MVFKTTLEQTNNCYSTILMTHPPLVGPALHLHPHGAETFYVIEGSYIFTLDGKIIETEKGDFVVIPKNIPHKYKSGENGGQIVVLNACWRCNSKCGRANCVLPNRFSAICRSDWRAG